MAVGTAGMISAQVNQPRPAGSVAAPVGTAAGIYNTVNYGDPMGQAPSYSPPASGGVSTPTQPPSAAPPAYSPTGPWTDPYASTMTATPSNSMEDAWAAYGQNYGGVNNSQSYYNNASGQLGQPGVQADLYSSMSGYGPSAGANALQGITQSLGGAGSAQNAFDQYGQSYMDPSASAGAYSTAQGQLGGASQSQQRYDQYGSQYGAPTAIGNLAASNPYSQTLNGEALGNDARSLYGNSTYSQNNMGNVLQNANAPSELAQQAGNLSNIYGSANNVQQFQSANQPQLSGPGALEQFAASDLNRTNPYYDMLQSQQAATIDQAAAARGAYGAGGSLAAQAMGSANLRAQQYQQEGQLQGSAQQAQLARLGLGANVAQGASSEAMNQGNALSTLAQNMFGDRMQGQQLGLSATGQADQANMARLSGITNMTQAGDNATLGRLAGQATLANDASTSNLNYLNSGMTAAGQADSSLLARQGLLGQLAGQSDSQHLNALAGYSNMANSADAAQLGRGQLIANTAGQVDQSQQAYLNSLSSMASNVDANSLAKIQAGSQMANQADAQSLNYLNGYFNQANAAQTAGLNRFSTVADQSGKDAAAQAALYAAFYGQGGEEATNLGVNSVNAATNGTATGAAAQSSANKNILGFLTSLYGGGAKNNQGNQ